MTNFKEIQISEIFDIIGENSKLTKTFIEDNKGDFPVFSGETKNGGAYGYINFYKHEEEILIWTTYGDAGNLRIVNGKFNIGRNASGLRIKYEFKNKVYFQYVKYLCEIYFKLNAQGGKGELRKLPQQRVKDIFIKLPLNENGDFDLEKQKEIALKYEKLEKLKDRIRIMKENLESQVIEFGESIEGEEISISEKFDLFSGDKVRKIQNHQGKYPIIGSQTKNNGIIASTNTPFFKDCSPNNLYVTFGDHTRYFQIRSMPFSNTDAVKVLKLKNAFQDKFDLSYLLYTWRKLIPNQGYARHWSVAKRITIKVPTRPDGSFNLEKQKEIAHKYEKIEKMKSDLIQELEYLESVKVEI